MLIRTFRCGSPSPLPWSLTRLAGSATLPRSRCPAFPVGRCPVRIVRQQTSRRRYPVPDPLSLARMRASRTVPMPMDQADLQALREAADAAGRRLIEVQAHNGRRHLMLGWPADVDPASALSAAGQEARTATPATLLPLAAC